MEGRTGKYYTEGGKENDLMPFCGYPSAVVYATPGDTRKKNAIQHCIWGDWITTLGPPEGEWVPVRARLENGWVHQDDLQEERLLELNFVDVGQGDGCFIVTPKDKWIIVDAGEGDNMFRFLRWRFRGFKQKFTFESAIITHSDQDHYGGFSPLFKEPNVLFQTIYHNGIVERAGNDLFGPTKKVGRTKYLTDVVKDHQALKRVLGDPQKRGQKEYANLLWDISESGRAKDIRMLCSEDGFLPGYEVNKDLSIRVLGPVTESGPNGERWLRWFESESKTKNGHSIVFQMRYRNVTLLLGGDLNIPSEKYLLGYHSGLNPEPKTAADEAFLLQVARRTFESDLVKACHHGSGDFMELYLQAINPLATVISSGDNESYSHPRPDALGATGRYSRGPRPLIFSTELARSAKENIKHPYLLQQQIKDLFKQLAAAQTEAEKKAIEKKLTSLVSQLERSIAIYGMINLRTDGKRVVFAQKLEQPRSNAEKWDVHQLEPGPDGRLRYVSE
jgi:beta-lactamase superfamily II metal-dependent hydrolase